MLEMHNAPSQFGRSRCVCVCTCVRIHTHTGIRVHLSTYTCTYMCPCIYLYSNAQIHFHLKVIYRRSHSCRHACIHGCTCTCSSVCLGYGAFSMSSWVWLADCGKVQLCQILDCDEWTRKYYTQMGMEQDRTAPFPPCSVVESLFPKWQAAAQSGSQPVVASAVNPAAIGATPQRS